MASSPYFSFIVPTYNRSDFIQKTLESLLNQSFKDYEIIVVDDGSTDNTEEVVNRMTDDRLHFYRKENGERGAARNYGARKATGKYVNFFDSDDLAYTHHLQKARDFIAELSDPEIFHLGFDVKTPEDIEVRRADALPQRINDLLISGNHLSCNGVFVRRDIALAFPFSEDRALSASEDYELWLRLASRFTIWHSNEITSTIIDHDSRSVVTINKNGLLNRITLLIKSLGNDDQFTQKYGPRRKMFESYLDIYVALHLAMSKQYPLDSLKFLLSSVVKYPPIFFKRRFFGVLKNVF